MSREYLSCPDCSTKYPLIPRAEMESVNVVPNTTPQRAIVRLVSGLTFIVVGDEKVRNLLEFFSFPPDDTDLVYVGPPSITRQWESCIPRRRRDDRRPA